MLASSRTAPMFGTLPFFNWFGRILQPRFGVRWQPGKLSGDTALALPLMTSCHPQACPEAPLPSPGARAPSPLRSAGALQSVAATALVAGMLAISLGASLRAFATTYTEANSVILLEA